MHCKHIERHVKKSTCWTISQERWHLKHHKSECHAQQLFSASTMSPVVLTAFSWGEPSLGWPCLGCWSESTLSSAVGFTGGWPAAALHHDFGLFSGSTWSAPESSIGNEHDFPGRSLLNSMSAILLEIPGMWWTRSGLYSALPRSKQTLWKSSAQPWISRSVSRILLGPRRMQVVLPWGPSRK